MQLPGNTRTVVSTFVSTQFSVVNQPGQTVFNTRTVFSTNFIQQTITQPGRTQTVFSTVVQPVFTTFFSTIFRGNTQTQFVTSTQFSQRVQTSVSVVQVPNQNTRTVTVPQVSTSVVFRNTIITSTGFHTSGYTNPRDNTRAKQRGDCDADSVLDSGGAWAWRYTVCHCSGAVHQLHHLHSVQHGRADDRSHQNCHGHLRRRWRIQL